MWYSDSGEGDRRPKLLTDEGMGEVQPSSVRSGTKTRVHQKDRHQMPIRPTSEESMDSKSEGRLEPIWETVKILEQVNGGETTTLILGRSYSN